MVECVVDGDVVELRRGVGSEIEIGAAASNGEGEHGLQHRGEERGRAGDGDHIGFGGGAVALQIDQHRVRDQHAFRGSGGSGGETQQRSIVSGCRYGWGAGVRFVSCVCGGGVDERGECRGRCVEEGIESQAGDVFAVQASGTERGDDGGVEADDRSADEVDDLRE
ncbi:unannotated protein [freshwater metagenome]|uniref:Unannotated protein n=1 Tax=freshwater metagenome TaxID=449393 RepID=A0A6J5YJC4_9ZZZZ